jgi:MFS family permease
MRTRWHAFPFSPARWPFFYGWIILVVAALGVLMSAPGQTLGVSVFTDHLLEALGLSRVELSTAYMLGTVGSALLLTQAGGWCDRWGARAMGVVSCLALGGVLVVLSRIDGLAGWLTMRTGLQGVIVPFTAITLAFFALRFWGQGMLTLSSQTMLLQWFEQKRGLVNGLSGILVALGFSGTPLVFDLLIRQWGWRGAWLGMGVAIGIVFALVAAVFYRRTPESCGLLPDGRAREDRHAADRHDSAPGWTMPEARRTAIFWVYTGALALFGLYMTGLTFHLVSIFSAAGMTRTQAVAIFLPASVIAVTFHMTGGWLSDRRPLRLFLVVMLLGQALSMGSLMLLGRGLPYWTMIVGNGIASGMFGVLSAVTWPRLFGRRHLGAISGMCLSLTVCASALGPFLFSQAFALTGGYRPMGMGCALLVAGLLLAAFIVSPPDSRVAARAPVLTSIPEEK